MDQDFYLNELNTKDIGTYIIKRPINKTLPKFITNEIQSTSF